MGPLGICSDASYRLRRFTHIIASAVEIVSTVHGDVKRMHLSPAVCCAGFGEVAWRGRRHKEVKAAQHIAVDFSFICSPSWLRIGPTLQVLLL